jgi:hypothetical protein
MAATSMQRQGLVLTAAANDSYSRMVSVQTTWQTTPTLQKPGHGKAPATATLTPTTAAAAAAARPTIQLRQLQNKGTVSANWLVYVAYRDPLFDRAGTTCPEQKQTGRRIFLDAATQRQCGIAVPLRMLQWLSHRAVGHTPVTPREWRRCH